MIVLDASAVVDWLLRTEAGHQIEKRIYAHHESLHAPCLLDVEVLHALRRIVRRGEIPGWRAGEAIADLNALRVTLYPHEPLLPRIWQMRHNLSAYDGAYVALAEELRAALITRDSGIAAASGHSATIELF